MQTQTSTTDTQSWINQVIRQDEIDKYTSMGQDFINDEAIEKTIQSAKAPDRARLKEILAKSRTIELLTPEETAELMMVDDPEYWEEMFETAAEVKHKVYDNRIVTFAPLYCSSLCVNSCLYCGFKKENTTEKRRILSMDEIAEETKALCAIGHKRLIMSFGEHPKSDANYIADSIKTVYKEKVKARQGYGQIRRVNVNAAPMSIEDLKKLWEAGIGTFQVFQETYHHDTYAKYHPSGIKSNYAWRLYALHRAMEAGVDDVGMGVLFGLYDWRFEMLGFVHHARDLEDKFSIGPHTVSFPRINPAEGTRTTENNPYLVSDDDFMKIVTIIRLSIPYTGMIITARETPEIRRKAIPLGCTQTDASTRIGIGAYSEQYTTQEKERQQFMLGDTRSLEELIKEFAEQGIITSFCTAGYRCGRTGEKIMNLLQTGQEGKFCKLNAVLTFREWLNDYASEETQKAGEKVIASEMEEIRNDPYYQKHNLVKAVEEYYGRIRNGERDLYL